MQGSLWNLIEEESGPPQENMDRDALALSLLTPESAPQLRFYHWEGLSATYGYFIDPHHYFNPEGLKRHELKIARRPTGGGILFHHVDLAFSVLLPSSHPYYGKSVLEAYRTLNGFVLNALKQCGFSDSHLIPAAAEGRHDSFCMAHPTIYDLVCAGKKIAGAAQRRTRNGLLYQGSLCLKIPDEGFLKDVLLPRQGLVESMQQLSYPLGLSGAQEHEFKKQLFKNLQNFPGVKRF